MKKKSLGKIFLLGAVLVATAFGCTSPTVEDAATPAPTDEKSGTPPPVQPPPLLSAADYPCLNAGDDIGNRALKGQPGRSWNIHDEYAALAREVPGGFGGVFLNSQGGRGLDGRTNIFLLDLSKADEAIALLRTRFVGPQLGPLHAIQGQFDYLQLRSCWEVFRQAVYGPGSLGVRGISSLGISTGRNRIEIGVLDLSVEPRLRDKLRELKIPQEMVKVERQPLIVPA